MHEVISDIGEGFMDCIRLFIALPMAMLAAASTVIRDFIHRA
jgi:hypothetical protein